MHLDSRDDGSTSVGFGVSQTEEESHPTSHDQETRSEGQPEEASDEGHVEKATVPRERSSVAPSRVTLRTPTECKCIGGHDCKVGEGA